MPGNIRKKLPRVTGPTNEVEQELADYYGKFAKMRSSATSMSPYGKRVPYKDGEEDPDIPYVEPPPMFRKPTALPVDIAPPGVGVKHEDPEQLEESPWDYLYRVVPELQGRSGRIHMGADRGSMDALASSGFNAEDYPNVNLGGTTTVSTGDISINPRQFYNQPELDETTAHEMGHTVGIPHDSRAGEPWRADMSNVTGLMRMARDYQRMQKRKK